MAGGGTSYPILLFSPRLLLGIVFRSRDEEIHTYRASFFLIIVRFSGVDRTRIVNPSAS
jgi:hypothetical protein